MTTTEHPKAEFPSDEPTALSVSGIPEGTRSSDAGGVRSYRVLTLLAATAGYLLLSVMLWWHVWSNHPTSTTTCGCGDSSLFTWFLAWPAYAFSHGLDPLYSTAMFHSAGVNLLSNTAEVGIGVVLAPVTWLFGAVATFNVALTLSPVLSALAMFVLLRRWVRWTPAAFIGGLFYGFSPFVLIALTVPMSLALRVVTLVFFGGGALVFIASIATRRVALRVDASGVTLGGSPGRYGATTVLIPWADIREIVLWRQPMPYGRSVRYVGVARRKGTRPLAGRRGQRAAKATARALTPGVSGDTLLASRAVNLWHLDTQRMAAAVAHFAPGVRVIDRNTGQVAG